MSKKLRKTWEQRSQERTKQETIKALEKQMKGEKQAEKDVCGWNDCAHLVCL
jgi:rRNA-processing protein CGR1